MPHLERRYEVGRVRDDRGEGRTVGQHGRNTGGDKPKDPQGPVRRSVHGVGGCVLPGVLREMVHAIQIPIARYHSMLGREF